MNKDVQLRDAFDGKVNLIRNGVETEFFPGMQLEEGDFLVNEDAEPTTFGFRDGGPESVAGVIVTLQPRSVMEVGLTAEGYPTLTPMYGASEIKNVSLEESEQVEVILFSDPSEGYGLVGAGLGSFAGLLLPLAAAGLLSSGGSAAAASVLVPAEQPTDVPVDSPVDTPVDVPVDGPSSVPVPAPAPGVEPATPVTPDPAPEPEFAQPPADEPTPAFPDGNSGGSGAGGESGTNPLGGLPVVGDLLGGGDIPVVGDADLPILGDPAGSGGIPVVGDQNAPVVGDLINGGNVPGGGSQLPDSFPDSPAAVTDAVDGVTGGDAGALSGIGALNVDPLVSADQVALNPNQVTPIADLQNTRAVGVNLDPTAAGNTNVMVLDPSLNAPVLDVGQFSVVDGLNQDSIPASPEEFRTGFEPVTYQEQGTGASDNGVSVSGANVDLGPVAQFQDVNVALTRTELAVNIRNLARLIETTFPQNAFYLDPGLTVDELAVLEGDAGGRLQSGVLDRGSEAAIAFGRQTGFEDQASGFAGQYTDATNQITSALPPTTVSIYSEALQTGNFGANPVVYPPLMADTGPLAPVLGQVSVPLVDGLNALADLIEGQQGDNDFIAGLQAVVTELAGRFSDAVDEFGLAVATPLADGSTQLFGAGTDGLDMLAQSYPDVFSRFSEALITFVDALGGAGGAPGGGGFDPNTLVLAFQNFGTEFVGITQQFREIGSGGSQGLIDAFSFNGEGLATAVDLAFENSVIGLSNGLTNVLSVISAEFRDTDLLANVPGFGMGGDFQEPITPIVRDATAELELTLVGDSLLVGASQGVRTGATQFSESISEIAPMFESGLIELNTQLDRILDAYDLAVGQAAGGDTEGLQNTLSGISENGDFAFNPDLPVALDQTAIDQVTGSLSNGGEGLGAVIVDGVSSIQTALLDGFDGNVVQPINDANSQGADALITNFSSGISSLSSQLDEFEGLNLGFPSSIPGTL